MTTDESVQDLEDEARQAEREAHPDVLGAPIPPPSLVCNQFSTVVRPVVPEWASLVSTVNSILSRLDRLEQLITDEQGRHHDGVARSVDDGIVTPWDYYRGEVERLVLKVSELQTVVVHHIDAARRA